MRAEGRARYGGTRIALLVLTVVTITFPAWFQLAELLRNFNPVSLDGKFQTYATAQLIGAGTPFRDFPVYLGLLLVSTVRTLALVTGRDVVGVQVAAILLMNVTLVSTLLTLSHLARIPHRARPWIWILLPLLLWFAEKPRLLELNELVTPGASLSACRGLIVILATLLVTQIESAKRPLGLWARPLLYGAMAGVASLWGNDFGLGTAIALIATPVLLALRPFDPRRAALALPIAMLAALAVHALILFGFGATPADWWRSNVTETAGTQPWLFHPWDEGRRALDLPQLMAMAVGLRTFGEAPAGSLVILACVAAHAANLGKALWAGKDRTPRQAGWIALSIAGWCGAMIPSAGGHFQGHYWALFLLAGPFALCAALPDRWFKTTPGAGGSIGWRSIMTGAAIVWIGTTLLLFSPWTNAWAGRIAASGTMTFDRSLRAGLTPREAGNFERFRAVRALFDRCGLPADGRVLEAYPSLVGVALGARQSNDAVSIIGVLGSQAERRFDAMITHRPPPFATTIAPDYAMWGDWNLRARWFWYRALIARYRPVARTDQHILWVRDATPRPADAAAACTLSRRSPAETIATVVGGRRGEAIELAIDYATQSRPTGLSTPFRRFVTAREMGATMRDRGWPVLSFDEAENTRHPDKGAYYGLPPAGRDVRTIIVPEGTAPVRLLLTARPSRTAALDIRACRARRIAFSPYAPLPDLAKVPDLTGFARSGCGFTPRPLVLQKSNTISVAR